jgi:hypothetical protein
MKKQKAKKVITNLEIHQSTRDLSVIGTFGKSRRFENKKRSLKADITGRKTAKHKGRTYDN